MARNYLSSLDKRLHHEILPGGSSQVISKCIGIPWYVRAKHAEAKSMKTFKVPNLYRLMDALGSLKEFI